MSHSRQFGNLCLAGQTQAAELEQQTGQPQSAALLRYAHLTDEKHSPSRGRVAGPILRRLDKAYVDNLRNAHSNTFFRLRVASGLLLLEASILVLQGQREEKDPRFWTEVAASALTTAAAGMELLAVGTEQALATVGQNSVTARGAQISLGRYRLWGVGLAAAGAAVAIWWDYQDLDKESNKPDPIKNEALMAAYHFRIAGTIFLVSGQGGIAFSQASAYFSWLALKSETLAIKNFFKIVSKLSSRLAAQRTLMLLLGRAYWIGGAVVIIATIALLIFDGNALERWCDKCCFTRNKEDNRYIENNEELAELINAIKEVL